MANGEDPIKIVFEDDEPLQQKGAREFTVGEFDPIDFNEEFANKTTDDLAEGASNLYFQTSRVRAVLASDNVVSEGDNVSVFVNDAAYFSKSSDTTDNVVEGSTSLFFTNARALDAVTGTITTDEIVEGSTNLFYTKERVEDAVNSLLVAGNSLNATYNDSIGTFTFDVVAPGSDADLVFNDSGSLGASSNLTYNSGLRNSVSGETLFDVDETNFGVQVGRNLNILDENLDTSFKIQPTNRDVFLLYDKLNAGDTQGIVGFTQNGFEIRHNGFGSVTTSDTPTFKLNGAQSVFNGSVNINASTGQSQQLIQLNDDVGASLFEIDVEGNGSFRRPDNTLIWQFDGGIGKGVILDFDIEGIRKSRIIYNDGNETLAFRTDGTERIVMPLTGNVEIPNDWLSVGRNDPVATITGEGPTGQTLLSLREFNGSVSTPAFEVESNGNFTAGTTSSVTYDGTQLTLSSNASTEPFVTVEGSDVSRDAKLGVIELNGQNYPGVWFGQSNPTAANYSFLSALNGGTIFNSQSGTDIDFRIGNGTRMTLPFDGGMNINSIAGQTDPIINANDEIGTSIFRVSQNDVRVYIEGNGTVDVEEFRVGSNDNAVRIQGGGSSGTIAFGGTDGSATNTMSRFTRANGDLFLINDEGGNINFRPDGATNLVEIANNGGVIINTISNQNPRILALRDNSGTQVFDVASSKGITTLKTTEPLTNGNESDGPFQVFNSDGVVLTQMKANGQQTWRLHRGNGGYVGDIAYATPGGAPAVFVNPKGGGGTFYGSGFIETRGGIEIEDDGNVRANFKSLGGNIINGQTTFNAQTGQTQSILQIRDEIGTSVFDVSNVATIDMVRTSTMNVGDPSIEINENGNPAFSTFTITNGSGKSVEITSNEISVEDTNSSFEMTAGSLSINDNFAFFNNLSDGGRLRFRSTDSGGTIQNVMDMESSGMSLFGSTSLEARSGQTDSILQINDEIGTTLFEVFPNGVIRTNDGGTNGLEFISDKIQATGPGSRSAFYLNFDGALIELGDVISSSGSFRVTDDGTDLFRVDLNGDMVLDRGGIQANARVSQTNALLNLTNGTNASTGDPLSVFEVATDGKTDVDNDIETLPPGTGIIVTSPDGNTKRRIGIDNAGNVITTTV